MKRTPPGLRAASSLYRLLLRLFPPAYRKANAAEFVTFFEEAYAEDHQARGWVGIVIRMSRAVFDVLGHAAAEWWSVVRHLRGARLSADLATDLKYAVRSIRQAPGLMAITVLTVGLGVGANSAIFSIVNAVLLKPLPYSEPEQLVTVWEANTALDGRRMSPSYPNFLDIARGQRSFESMAAVATQSALLRGREGTEERRVAFTALSPAAFDVLRVSPVLGRRFGTDDVDGSLATVAVLSHTFWEQQFGADENVLGKTVDFVGASLTVIGVMPEGFAFPDAETEVWVPLSGGSGSWEVRAAHIVTAIARLAPGVSLERAEDEMIVLMDGIQAAHPGEDPAHSAMVLPLDEVVVENVRTALLLLFGAVAVVLLIVCVNVANLTLARSVSRGREMAVRASMGAGRGRLVRQLLAEGLLLATLSAVVGLLMADWAVGAIVPLVPEALPRTEAIAVDGTVLVFALAVAVVTGVVFSLAPALHCAKLDLVAGLRARGGSAGSAPIRVRRSLVAVEVALSSVLLVGAGLLIGSFWRVVQVDPGFDPQQMVTTTVSLFPETREETVEFYRSLPDYLEAMPEVDVASAVNALPISGGDSRGSVTVEGRTFPDGTAPGAGYRRVLPGYFAAMGIPMLEGRDFDARDDASGAFVTIIDASMARRLWPDESPIGRRIKVGPPENEPWLTIVGVVGDVSNEGLERAPLFATYEPHPQRPWTTMNVIVRTRHDPATVSATVRQRLLSLDPDLAVYGSNTMQRRIRDSFASRRFHMILLGGFASVALVLAVVGIYGVLSYSVTERRQEIGIRMALGASAERVHRGVVSDALGLALIGTLLGAGMTVLVARTLRSFVFEVSVIDPVTLAGVAFLLIAVAFGASVIPARRATRVNPVEVLGGE